MNDRLRLEPYLELAMDKGASDLYFTTHAPVMMRVEGQLHPLRAAEAATLTPTVLEQLVHDTLTEEQREVFAAERELDFAFRYGMRGRFRANVFRQRGSAAMVLRNIGHVPTLAEFEMPDVLARLAMQKRGLVLVVGATGAGKSTTLAAMLNHRNESSSNHILTIEDPVEFMFRHKRSIVNQREIGTDTNSFARALRSAIREAPDVVQIGEVRDHETADACLQLANTGHLAMATMHASNTYQCLQRLTSLFPESARTAMYMDLSLNLRAIVCQRLVATPDGKRTAAYEILLNTPHIADLILNGRLDAVAEALSVADGADGAISFDNALIGLVQAGRISAEEAQAHADSPDNLHSRMMFDQR
ncbi:PilT/PilU family type 4a pilus ATPase [Salinisphaera sp. Q1T1-3]|uniref:PilT/PilU family type 4a pilus ATPase n=1 Tax=Salinisphaera sp. Q1T1-3 TaxID=2321229 RepID=UPI000E7084EE|nr:PilT/PilU family type 4a pilus ATPase [Salinisphaera sp. Q1T1-3]RJS94808.1 PilT/PilU family type 4a pilus ATPase [Salinisphaera sp. Q1T1-3]